ARRVRGEAGVDPRALRERRARARHGRAAATRARRPASRERGDGAGAAAAAPGGARGVGRAEPQVLLARGVAQRAVAGRMSLVRGVAPVSDLLPARMSEPTSLVPLSEGATRYASTSLAAGRDWFEAVMDLTRRIHADFEFQPGATTVSTSVDEVLYQRHGVCQ